MRLPHRVKRAWVRGVSSVLYYSGVLALERWLRKRRGGRGVVVVCLHECEEGSLRRAVRYWKQHCEVLSLGEYAGCRAGRRAWPANGVVVTMDDGTASQGRMARLLAAEGMPATVFVATDACSDREAFWWDRLRGWVAESERRAIVWRGRRYGLRGQRGRERSAARLTLALKTMGERERTAALEELWEVLGRPAESEGIGGEAMGWEAVEALAGVGVEVGGHTMSHAIVTRLGEDAAREEITGCKRELEERLGGEVRSFAYPNGGRADVSAACGAMVEEAGYACGVTTVRGVADGREAMWAVPRVCLPERFGVAEAAMAVSGWIGWWPWWHN